MRIPVWITAIVFASVGGAAIAAAGTDSPKPATAAAGSSAGADYSSVVASPMRSDDDRKADERRKPLELLRFAQVRPGMNVMDVSAGNGYTTQLLALAVGDKGSVWAQMSKPRPGFDKRLAANPQANIHLLVRSFEDPYPADAPRLDLITFVLNYHDVANQQVDRAVMNQHLFEALRPGGHLVVIDHATRPGTGLKETGTLHRIDEATVVQELQTAGFVVEERSDFLRNPDDPREQAHYDMKAPTDRFALRLLRP